MLQSTHFIMFLKRIQHICSSSLKSQQKISFRSCRRQCLYWYISIYIMLGLFVSDLLILRSEDFENNCFASFYFFCFVFYFYWLIDWLVLNCPMPKCLILFYRFFLPNALEFNLRKRRKHPKSVAGQGRLFCQLRIGHFLKKCR